MDVTIKKKEQLTSPLILNVTNEDGTTSKYTYKIGRMSNMDMIHAASGAVEAEYGTLYHLISTSVPEGDAPALQDLVNKMDNDTVLDLHQALIAAATKDLTGEVK